MGNNYNMENQESKFYEKEEEPLSMDNPIDWYYDDTDETGYPTKCVISLFSEYLRKYNISIKIWGVSFDDDKPMIDSKDLEFTILESNVKSGYVHMKLYATHDNSEDCQCNIEFHDDFYFSFFNTNEDGIIEELDYYDDVCQK